MKQQFPDLVIVVAGARDAETELARLISDGTVYRFIHKPMSPARARLFADAAVKRYEDQRRRLGEQTAAAAKPSGTAVLMIAGDVRRSVRSPAASGRLTTGIAGARLRWWRACRRPTRRHLHRLPIREPPSHPPTPNCSPGRLRRSPRTVGRAERGECIGALSAGARAQPRQRRSAVRHRGVARAAVGARAKRLARRTPG